MVFWQLTVDANDPVALARFWRAALGWVGAPPAKPRTTWSEHYRGRLRGEEEFDTRLFDPEGVRPPIFFQAVPEPKAGKNRLHLDLYPTGRDDTVPQEQRIAIVDATVAELVALGATVVTSVREDDPDDPQYFVSLRDPEGNEFDVS